MAVTRGSHAMRHLLAGCLLLAVIVVVKDDGLSFVQAPRMQTSEKLRSPAFESTAAAIRYYAVALDGEQSEGKAETRNWMSASFFLPVMMGFLLAFGGITHAPSVMAETGADDARENALRLDSERTGRVAASSKVRSLTQSEILRAEASVYDKARAARVSEAGKVTGAPTEADKIRSNAVQFDRERAARKQAASGDFPKAAPSNAAREQVAEAQKAYFQETYSKAAEAEMSNRAKAAAENADKRSAQAASSATTNLQNQAVSFEGGGSIRKISTIFLFLGAKRLLTSSRVV